MRALLSSGMWFQSGRSQSLPRGTSDSPHWVWIHAYYLINGVTSGLIGISDLVPWVWIGAPAEIPGAASGLI